jgi:hypothetical protein
MSRPFILLFALLGACGQPREIPVSRVEIAANADCTSDCPRPLTGLPSCSPSVQISDGEVTAPSGFRNLEIDGAFELNYVLTLGDSTSPLQRRQVGIAAQGQPVSVSSVVPASELYQLRPDGTFTVVDNAALVGQDEAHLSFRYQSKGATVTEEHQIRSETMTLEISDFSGSRCCASAGGRPMLATALAMAAFLVGRRRGRVSAR